MEIRNPFKMNDWEIGKFLLVIYIIQILVLAITVMNWLGLHVLILTEIIPLTYLLIVPGILILRILKIHEISSAEVVLYTVGLSVASIMVVGFLTNLLYPLIGVGNPISSLPLIISVTAFVLLLSVLSYRRDKEFSSPEYINSDDLLSPYVPFLLLIPFLAVYGAYLINMFSDNLLIVVLFAMISLTVLLFGFCKLPGKLYPLAIFIMSISLVLQYSLISNYITGWDIQTEYYFANIVLENAFWNLNIPNNIDTLLSITLLAPVISIFTSLSLESIFKIVYPLLFSLVPLGLYVLIKEQTSSKIAFLSGVLFISYNVFFTEMLALARQEIAELFVILLILVMVTRKLSNLNRTTLFIIFGASLILSHYGLSYIYIFSFLLVYLIILLNERFNIKYLYKSVFKELPRLLKGDSSQVGGKLEDGGISPFIKNVRSKVFIKKTRPIGSKPGTKYKILSFNFILFFLIFTLSWYMYTSSSMSLIVFINLGNKIATSVTSEFLNPISVQSLSYIQTQSNLLHSLFRYITYLTQFFIIIGAYTILFKNRMKFKKEYMALILVNVLIVILAITVPHFSSALNTERLYQISLIVLAPVCIIGGLKLLEIMDNLKKRLKIPINNLSTRSIQVLSIFLVIYLLFNSGVVYYLTGDDSSYPTSMVFNSTYDTAKYDANEVQGADWLSVYGIDVSEYENNTNSGLVVADDFRVPLMRKFGLNNAPFSYYYDPNFTIMNYNLMNYNQNKTNFYFFLGTNNILTNSIVIFNYQSASLTGNYKYENYKFSLSRIYDSNGAKIFYEGG